MPSTQETVLSTKFGAQEKHSTVNLKREFHNEEKSTYWLPKDDEEQARLTGQHFAYKELLNGNVLSSVREAVDFGDGVSVLDIGCGSGVWIMDMAQDFPNCTYDGCDIVNIVNKNLDVKQFTFREGNVLHGLPYPDNTFDFVHMRLLVYALREEEWPVAIKEAIRVVKPGGMLQLVESGLVLPKDSSSAYYKFVNANFSVCSSKGQNPRICEKIEGLVSANKCVNIKQLERRWCNTSDNSSVAKKFRWDGVELVKSSINYLKPILGLESKEDTQKYIEDFKNCLACDDCLFDITVVAAQKL